MPASQVRRFDPVMTAGRWARSKTSLPPWGSGLGLARTVLALGTLGTLLATPPQVLLSPLAGGIVPPTCTGITQASIWCAVPGGPQAARWLSVVILTLTASGWRPRLTAIPHWWVSWSLFASASIQDGGDQITAVLTLLLMPVALTDRRRWHWQRPGNTASGPLPRLVTVAALLLIQVQVAGLYLDAGISKLGVADWANGTAMFYFFRSIIFGPPSWLSPVLGTVAGSPVGVTMLTWGAVALEIVLGLALLLPGRARPALLAAGLVFHDAIALSMGLVSFDLAMSAALLLYLLPTGHQIKMPRWLGRARALLHARTAGATGLRLDPAVAAARYLPSSAQAARNGDTRQSAENSDAGQSAVSFCRGAKAREF
jgi:antimicrobial peptide system SdpB family protein